MEAKESKVKVTGFVITPIKGGNTEHLVHEALRAAESEGDVETELVHFQDYNIGYCIGCDGCVRRVNKLQREFGHDIQDKVKRYNCGIKDDMEIMHEKLLECDGAIFGAPVYILTVPGQFKVFIDRCRTFTHEDRLRGKKVATSISVAYLRNTGLSTTLNIMNLSLQALGFMLVTPGAGCVSSKDGVGIPIKDTRFAVEQDVVGMPPIIWSGQMVARMAKSLRSGHDLKWSHFSS